MNIRVWIARVMVVAVVFFGSFLTITSSLWWAPAFWVISGILACIISGVWEIFTNPFDLDQLIATVIVSCLGGFILLLIMATDHDNDKASRTPR